jgi:predicted nucleic acid-binding Zn ribbon protein
MTERAERLSAGDSRSRPRGPRQLSHAISSLRGELAPRTLLAAVQEHWPEAVGSAVSEQTIPASERGGTITVRCRSAVWASELSLLAEALLERVNRKLDGGRRARGLKFIVGPF